LRGRDCNLACKHGKKENWGVAFRVDGLDRALEER